MQGEAYNVSTSSRSLRARVRRRCAADWVLRPATKVETKGPAKAQRRSAYYYYNTRQAKVHFPIPLSAIRFA